MGAEEIELTDKQQRFIDEYVLDCNATQAAIRAGYSRDTARSIASQLLTKVNIRQSIDKLLKEKAVTAEETVKLMGDIAKSNLNDYITTRYVEIVPKIQVSLAKYIERKRNEYSFEQEYALMAGIEGDELDIHNKAQELRKKEIIRLEIELKRHPDAYRIINGDPVLEEIAEVDVPKLIRDKEAGRIKSFRVNDNGSVQVEMYPADAALTNLARIHGLFEKDNKQTRPEPIIPQELVQSIVKKMNLNADDAS